MAQGLSGLTGIAGYQVQIDTESQATPEERLGGTVDPKHGEVGETAQPYPWQSKATQAGQMHGPYGPENQMLGDIDEWVLTPAGVPADDPDMDNTPTSRAAPFPKGILSGPIPGEDPNALAEQRRQSAIIHGVRTGAGLRAMHALAPLQDEWVELDELNPGNSDLRPLDRQALSSGFMYGTRDRTQSMARQNEHGFDSAHMHRRYATGAIPGNTYWMRPGGRPMAKSLPGPARPAIGQDSPFAGQNLGFSFNPDGAVLQNVPSVYVPPPSTNLAPAVVSDENSSVVEWY